MEADDKRKVEEKGCDLNKKRFSSHCHRAELSENGEDVRPSTVWSVKEKGKFPLQCQSPTLETLQFPHEDGVSCEERDVDELGDLLRRFDTFFREKVDSELQSIRDFLHGMLSEQQIHLQQILNSRLTANSVNSQQETSSLFSGDEDLFHDHAVPEFLEESAMQLNASAESVDVYKRSPVSEILIEMMSLSLELSALLSQSKFL